MLKYFSIALLMLFLLTGFNKPVPAKKIVKDALLSEIFPVYPNAKNIDKMLGVKFTQTLSVKKNKINPTLTDTLIKCSYKKSVIGLGRIDGDDIFWFANINDAKIKLHNNIHTGISKAEFCKATNIELEAGCDTLQVSCGCAADASVKYIFKKNKLQNISYYYPLD